MWEAVGALIRSGDVTPKRTVLGVGASHQWSPCTRKFRCREEARLGLKMCQHRGRNIFTNFSVSLSLYMYFATTYDPGVRDLAHLQTYNRASGHAMQFGVPRMWAERCGEVGSLTSSAPVETVSPPDSSKIIVSTTVTILGSCAGEVDKGVFL